MQQNQEVTIKLQLFLLACMAGGIGVDKMWEGEVGGGGGEWTKLMLNYYNILRAPLNDAKFSTVSISNRYCSR